MAYEYESKLYANSVVHSMTENVFIETGETKEIKEVYRKAKAYDLLREDIEINEKVFKQQAENDEVSAIIHGHYLALLEQSELEDK